VGWNNQSMQPVTLIKFIKGEKNKPYEMYTITIINQKNNTTNQVIDIPLDSGYKIHYKTVVLQ
jgi:hypothetical protein